MDVSALRERLSNPSTAELELLSKASGLGRDAARERAFEAFTTTGLPHRRLEGWKWTDVKSALPQLEARGPKAETSPFSDLPGIKIEFGDPAGVNLPDGPDGLRMFVKETGQAFGGAENMPLGALTAALASSPAAVMIEVTEPVSEPLHLVFGGQGEAAFARVVFVVRPGASITVLESHLGGPSLSGALLEFGIQEGATLDRVLLQSGQTDEVQVATAAVHLGKATRFNQTAFATGAKLARLETRVTHQGEQAEAVLNAAYLVENGHHADFTSHVRHGALGCQTRQVTKGAARKGGRGVFQGKFLVARAAQQTDADMQHNALLLEDGAEVNAKPELEIYADDVACAHGNTCGALDSAALFYMRQRGIPEKTAKALLTEAHIAEAFDAIARDDVREVLLERAREWLASAL